MARNFDDTTNQEYLEVDEAVVTTFPLTMSAWFKPVSSAGDQQFCNVTDSSAGNAWYKIQDGLTSRTVRMVARNTTVRSAQTTNLWTDDAWNHVVGREIATDSRDCILNGDTANKGTDVNAVTAPAVDRTSIGRSGDSSPGYSDDIDIAEVGMWNVALSDDECAALADGYSPACIRPGALVLYQPLIRAINGGVGPIMTFVGDVVIKNHPRIIYPSMPYTHMAIPAVGGAVTAPLFHHHRHHNLAA